MVHLRWGEEVARIVSRGPGRPLRMTLRQQYGVREINRTLYLDSETIPIAKPSRKGEREREIEREIERE